jgi:hypothetical protein
MTTVRAHKRASAACRRHGGSSSFTRAGPRILVEAAISYHNRGSPGSRWSCWCLEIRGREDVVGETGSDDLSLGCAFPDSSRTVQGSASRVNQVSFSRQLSIKVGCAAILLLFLTLDFVDESCMRSCDVGGHRLFAPRRICRLLGYFRTTKPSHPSLDCDTAHPGLRYL